MKIDSYPTASGIFTAQDLVTLIECRCVCSSLCEFHGFIQKAIFRVWRGCFLSCLCMVRREICYVSVAQVGWLRLLQFVQMPECRRGRQVGNETNKKKIDERWVLNSHTPYQNGQLQFFLSIFYFFSLLFSSLLFFLSLFFFLFRIALLSVDVLLMCYDDDNDLNC